MQSEHCVDLWEEIWLLIFVAKVIANKKLYEILPLLVTALFFCIIFIK